MIWDKMDQLSSEIIEKFSSYNKEVLPAEYEHAEQGFSWKNYIWESTKFRRAHIEIVDARETKKMWVMHMCIFPHYDDPSPIFGFDIVCGKNKITGAFHDFSKVDDCYLYKTYLNRMEGLNWSKPRELPDWAKQIFSPQMLAVGNIQTQEEFDQLTKTVIDNLQLYIYNIGVRYTDKDYKEQHNHYCKYQKMNPHTPAMMVNFGVNKDVFTQFMNDVLFQEKHE
jgi:phycocyanobilin:ferredoxin oxidoreductase